MKIRDATANDLPNLALLFDAYRQFYGKPTNIEGAHIFLNERIKQQDSVIYVAENDQGKIGGFVQLYPLFSSTRLRRLWLLNDLYVDGQYRGQGISVGLIDKAKDLVRETNAAGMYLETEKSNTIGNKLYPKTGFKLKDEENFYEWMLE